MIHKRLNSDGQPVPDKPTPRDEIPNQMLIRRVDISDWDFNQAQKFGKYIVNNELRTKADEGDPLPLGAFSIAMVVSYCRPFLECKGEDGKKDKIFRRFLDDNITSEQRELHEVLINRRHQGYAHSDIIDKAPQLERGLNEWGMMEFTSQWKNNAKFLTLDQTKELLATIKHLLGLLGYLSSKLKGMGVGNQYPWLAKPTEFDTRLLEGLLE